MEAPLEGRNRFVAVGLLTQRDLDRLGARFKHAFPLDRLDAFTELLLEIDRAERRANRREPE